MTNFYIFLLSMTSLHLLVQGRSGDLFAPSQNVNPNPESGPGMGAATPNMSQFWCISKRLSGSIASDEKSAASALVETPSDDSSRRSLSRQCLAAAAKFYERHPYVILLLATSEAITLISRSFCRRRQPERKTDSELGKDDDHHDDVQDSKETGCEHHSSADRVVHVVVALNVGVFLAWKVALSKGEEAFLSKNFILSASPTQRQQCPHTYLTSCFSHITLMHLVSNMGCLYFFGPKMARALGGARKFSYFYVVSAYASDLADTCIFDKIPLKVMRVVQEFVVYVIKKELQRGENVPRDLIERFEKMVPDYKKHDRKRSGLLGFLRKRREQADGSLGASGAVSAVMSYSCLRFPHDKIGLRYLDDMTVPPAVAMILVTFLDDLLQLGTSTGIGHGAHLGGTMFGALVYLGVDIIWPLLKLGRARFCSWRRKWTLQKEHRQTGDCGPQC